MISDNNDDLLQSMAALRHYVIGLQLCLQLLSLSIGIITFMYFQPELVTNQWLLTLLLQAGALVGIVTTLNQLASFGYPLLGAIVGNIVGFVCGLMQVPVPSHAFYKGCKLVELTLIFPITAITTISALLLLFRITSMQVILHIAIVTGSVVLWGLIYIVSFFCLPILLIYYCWGFLVPRTVGDITTLLEKISMHHKPDKKVTKQGNSEETDQ